MQTYRNISGASDISAYQTGTDSITIRFNDRSIYLYTYTSAGSAEIETMKTLAKQGSGLNSYINKNVKTKYAKKL